jgi:branched-chain amino acid transport system permease protein
MQAMAIGGGIGGLAGFLYAILNGYMNPEDCLPIETFLVWAMVVIGGRGNVNGVVCGTILVQLFYVGSRFLKDMIHIPAETLAALRLVVIGLFIMLTMMYRREGVFPERKRIY